MARGERLGASDQPLCQVYDAGLYDLDGVLYLGRQPIAHAAETVRLAREAGLHAAFVTNNASRRPAVVAEHLAGLGIPTDPADVVTSGQVAVRLLKGRLPPGAAVLVLGTAGLAQEIAAGGLRPVRTVAEAGPNGPPAVVQGHDPATCWSDLAEACVAILAGALWVAGNRDSTYPTERGPLPGNGALVEALVAATGKQPEVVGKPEPALHRESVERVGARRPLVIGDRLDTDVLGAVRGGSDSLLVLTGVTDRTAVLAAPRGMRPTYVASDLRGLLSAHPEALVRRDKARCGQATASFDGDVLVTSGEGDDVLRAACALAWSRADG